METTTIKSGRVAAGANAECRMQNVERTNARRFFILHSSFCILHSKKRATRRSGPFMKRSGRDQKDKRSPTRACQRERRSATLNCRFGVREPSVRLPDESNVVEPSR